jgi:hypothetical protein
LGETKRGEQTRFRQETGFRQEKRCALSRGPKEALGANESAVGGEKKIRRNKNSAFEK